MNNSMKRVIGSGAACGLLLFLLNSQAVGDELGRMSLDDASSLGTTRWWRIRK